jgi:hypothetical protein|tara:strand:- start:966 stop:1406 length:441 start_codon:yes stop_codon:yes gene_type:complete
MSADPVTMFVFQATKTVMDIKSSKKQSKIEQQMYEDKKKNAARIAKEQEDDRIHDLQMAKAHNLAIGAGSGYSDQSRSFLNIQDQQDKFAQKDIARIRLNTTSEINQYSLSANMSKSQRSQDQFGSWLSIGSAAIETKAKKDLYDA